MFFHTNLRFDCIDTAETFIFRFLSFDSNLYLYDTEHFIDLSFSTMNLHWFVLDVHVFHVVWCFHLRLSFLLTFPSCPAPLPWETPVSSPVMCRRLDLLFSTLIRRSSWGRPVFLWCTPLNYICLFEGLPEHNTRWAGTNSSYRCTHTHCKHLVCHKHIYPHAHTHTPTHTHTVVV